MNELVWANWYLPNFFKVMEVTMEVVDLRSKIVFLIRLDDHIKMLYLKFQPSITILFITKSSLYKIWWHKV